MISIEIEKLDNCLEEMKPFLRKHYEEVFMYKEYIELNPNYESYYTFEENGSLLTVIVRDSGKLIGYFLSFLFESPHYRDHFFASNDIIYVDPECRHAGVGYDMIKFAEERLKEKGVSVMTINMKVAKPFEGLCKHVGMDKTEYLYTKYIGETNGSDRRSSTIRTGDGCTG